jgi:hypothetical protein
MSVSSQQLYDLLPTIHRLRDGENNEVLKSFLAVFAEQISVLKENIDQLYDDQFIETCAEWAVPYIADLIAYKTLHTKVTRELSQRAEVANTIAYRRRKGTATMLEQLARDVTGWPARVVEFFQLLATTQYMNHTRLQNHYASDLLNWQRMLSIGGAFDNTAHTVDVRHIDTDLGKHNIKNIGIYLWRLQSYSLTQFPLFSVSPGRYFLSPLRHDIPLFNRPVAESNITHLAEPLNVPHAINRRVMNAELLAYYGEGKSISIYEDLDNADGKLDIVSEKVIRICCLSDSDGNWINEPVNEVSDPPEGEPVDPGVFRRVIALDPETGRLAIPPHMIDDEPNLWATFHYGFSANMSAGEYERASAFGPAVAAVESVSGSQSIQTALDGLGGEGVVEIEDSGRYPETLSMEVNAGQRIELRAANEHRPLILLDGDLEIRGFEPASENDEGGVVTLDGLLIAGGSIVIPASNNGLRALHLRHCTLVPGITLEEGGAPVSPETPSIVIESNKVKVVIDDCIIGALRVVEGAQVSIENTIVDANASHAVAYAAPDASSAGGVLRIINSTVIGKVHTRIMQLASNCIFDARLAPADAWLSPLLAERKQQGCVRFSFVPLGARVPRRFRCQPEHTINQAIQKAQAKLGAGLNSAQKSAIGTHIVNRIKPSFTDTRYGQPAYMQLALSCAKEILRGADDESEMGAFHDLYQSQRETNLKIRLKEYLRFGLEAGIFYET